MTSINGNPATNTVSGAGAQFSVDGSRFNVYTLPAIDVQVSNLYLAINASISSTALWDDSFGGLGGGGFAECQLFLVNNGSGERFELASTYAMMPIGSRQDPIRNYQTVSVERAVAAGSYSLQLVHGGGRNSYCGRNEISKWSLSYNYEPSDNSTDVQIGLNGMSVVRNGHQMVHTTINPATGKLSHIVKGDHIDMPGVLAKARVASNGAISKQWGAYSITAVQNITSGDANKKVHHTFAKDSYTAIVTPIGKNVVANVIQEYASYVEIYSTGAFNIILTGNN